ncbi:MAG: ABC transporter substrate-binding protein [Candidatus Eiseniibacteriota bacterium]|nr:MAG: ABC transporter substrate-binding protein [Candidatus Eisenbacteria bacterium]
MYSGYRRAFKCGALLTLLFAVALSVCLVLACAKKTEEIRVGEFGSLTGTTATFGISTKNAIDLAIGEANEAGGINGKLIKVIVEDDQSKPEEAATAVRKLIEQDRVIAVLGEVSSSRSLAGAPICQNAKVPMITPSSTNPKVTQVGDYIFRVCFTDPFQGMVAAVFALDSLGAQNAAILRDIRNDYSVGLADFFIETFTSRGGKIVADESYSEGDIDFKAQLTAIKAKFPDVVFIPGYYTEVGLIARQARELGIERPLLGGDGWVSDRLIDIGGEALNGCYFVNPYWEQDPDPAVQKFVVTYRERFGGNPDGMAALAYDAGRFLVAGLKKLAEEEPEVFTAIVGLPRAETKELRAQALAKLRDIFASTRDFPGITGSISIDENRNAVKPAIFLTIEDRQYKFVGKVLP